MSPGASKTNGISELTRHDSYDHDNVFYSRRRNRRSESGANQQKMSYAYQEDTDKKDQRWALLGEGSMPLAPDEDGPAIMDATTPVTDEGDRTYETLSK
jgi:hypothetical protein